MTLDRGQGVGLRLATTAILAIAAACAAAAPARAASITATVKAKVIKPLTLQSTQDLDLGTVMLGPGSWSGAVVRLNRNGAFTCPAQVSCSGVTQLAGYTLSGSNKETVVISAPSVTMVNQSDGTRTVTLVPDAPASITLTNSSARGVSFPVGGSITIDSTTAGGTYVGTFSVTAEYQ